MYPGVTGSISAGGTKQSGGETYLTFSGSYSLAFYSIYLVETLSISTL